MSKIDISKYFTPDLKQARKRTNQAIEELKFELSDAHRKIGTGKFYYIHTYGCQGNEADSESIAGILELMGFAKSEVEIVYIYLRTYPPKAKGVEDSVVGSAPSYATPLLLSNTLYIR